MFHIKSNYVRDLLHFIRLRTTPEGIEDGLLWLMWILVIYSSLKPGTAVGSVLIFSYGTFLFAGDRNYLTRIA